MHKNYQRSFSWDFYSCLIIVIYSLLQILRWKILPQFMDIYYHLLTAWGFIQAGGYSGWDFWQYAPFGRIHIYPPFFHIILAFLIKLGINKIILAKSFETVMPILFLIALWHFIRKNYTKRLAFLVLIAVSSSFSFYLSLINNHAATLAMVIGILLYDQLFQNRLLRSILLLALCFYTHIGVSYFITFSIIIYTLFDRQYIKKRLIIIMCAIILSIPIIFKQLAGLKFIYLSGITERYFCEFKTIDYMLAFFGIMLAWKMSGKYQLFLSLFLASFIFLIYPYRFFSGQGYLAIIFLSAVSIDNLYDKFQDKKNYLKYLPIALTAFILLVSPTVLMERPGENNKINYKVYAFDSAFMDMVFAGNNERASSKTLWFPDVYLPTAALIKQNSEDGDIIYSSSHIISVCLASISERATANSIFPEIGPSREFNPISVSRIFIALKDDKPDWVRYVVNKYNLIKIGENKAFVLYKNPKPNAKIDIKKASLPFAIIWLICFVFIALFWAGRKLTFFE